MGFWIWIGPLNSKKCKQSKVPYQNIQNVKREKDKQPWKHGRNQSFDHRYSKVSATTDGNSPPNQQKKV